MISLLQILEQCDLTDYDICFVQIGENDVKTAKDDSTGLNNHNLMHALINIVEEFHRQCVRRLVFVPLFPRHHSGVQQAMQPAQQAAEKHARCEYYEPF